MGLRERKYQEDEENSIMRSFTILTLRHIVSG
jgi:hypothetical protein